MSKVMRFTGTAANVVYHRGLFGHGEAIGIIIIGLILSVIGVLTDIPSIRPDYKLFNHSTGTVSVNYATSQKPTFVVKTSSIANKTKPAQAVQSIRTDKGTITTKVTTADGKSANVKANINAKPDDPGQYTVALSPDGQPAPGRYKIQVLITENGTTKTVTQDFTWGVLALNFDKSTYTPGEKSLIGMAVLDDAGVTQCDAKTKLEITHPDKSITTLSTDDKSITISDTCKDKSVTNKPDYATNYTPTEQGEYSVQLTAETKNGKRTMNATFKVIDHAAFVSERHDTAMRLYPAASYNVDLLLTANQAVNGFIQEQVPQSFVVTNPKLVIKKASGAIKIVENSHLRIDEQGDNRTMTWGGVSLAKGDRAEVTYTYQPPYISPAFYQLGPAKISDNRGKTAFEEPREWQLASDSVNDVIVLWDSANGAVPAGWTCVSCSVSDDFYQRFANVSTTYAGTGGGPETQTHTLTYASQTAGATAASAALLPSKAISSTGHTHTWSNITTSSYDIKPPYKDLMFIKASNPLGLPQFAIAMFDVASVASLPANWTSYKPLNDPNTTNTTGNGVYLRGANDALTGGTASHTAAITLQTSGAGSGTTNTNNATGTTFAAPTHTHTIAAQNLTAEPNDPLFTSVVFAQVGVANLAIPTGMIAMFDNTTLPTGWSGVTTIGGATATNRLLKGTLGTAVGLTGGTSTRTPGGLSSLVFTTSAPIGTISGANSGLGNTNVASGTHTHTATFGVNAVTTLPNYRSVILGKMTNVTYSGTVYSDEGTTPLGSVAVKAAVNGVAYQTTTAAANGTYSIPLPDPGPGGTVTVWLTGTQKGETVMRTNSGAVSGLNIFQDRLVVRHEDAGPISNSDINDCDFDSGVVCSGDASLHYRVTTGDLTVNSDTRLYINTADTFTPGGRVTLTPGALAANVGGDLKFAAASSTLNIGTNDLNVGGDWDNTIGGTFTKSSGQTTTMTGTVTGLTVVSSSKNFEKLTFNGSGGAWAFTPTATAVNVDNDFSITTGTVTAPSGTLNVGGSWTNGATFTHNSGTVVFNGTASGKTINPGSSNFNNMTFNGSGGAWSPLTNTVNVLADLTMTNGTFDTSNGTANVTVNGNVQGTAGIINMTSTNTFTQRVGSGKAFGTTSGSTNWTFNNLTFSNSNAGATPVTITTNTDTGTVTVGDVLKIGNTGDATGATTTLDAGVLRVWNLSGTSGNPFQILASPAAVLTANTAAFFYLGNNPSGNTTVTAATYYKLVIQNGSETFVPSGSLVANQRVNVNSGTFDLGANNITVGSAGVTNSGFINVLAPGTYTQSSPGTTTILSSSGATAVQIGGVGSTTFYNLSFLPTVASAPSFEFGNTPGGTITVSNNLTIGNGTNPVNVNASIWNPTLSVGGNATIASNATLVASGSSAFTIGGNYTNSGTFTHSSGTVTFNSTATGKTINPGGSSFGGLTFNGSGGGWTVQTNPATITGDLFMANGTLGSSVNITANGNVQCQVTCGTINAGNTFTQSVSANKNFGTNVAGSTSWTFNNLTFDASANSPTISFNGPGTATGSTNVTGNLSLTKSGTALTVDDNANDRIIDVDGNVSIASGTTLQAPPSASFTVGGSWANSGTFTNNSGTLTFNSTSTGRTLTGAMTGSNKFYNATFNGSGGAWSFGANNAEVANNLTISAGTVTAPSTTLTVTGNYSNNGVFTHNSGTVLFNATTTGKTLAGTMTGTSKFYDLTFNGSGGAWSFGANNAEVADDFTITNGTVTAPSTTLTLNGNYSNSGTFTNNSGTVLFNATSTGKTIAGAMTGSNKFHTLTFNGVGGAWSFSSNSAEVADNFTITNGTVTAPSTTLTLTNNYSNAGTFTHNSGLVVFNAGSTGKTINPGLSSPFNNVRFDGSGGGWTIQTNAATMSGDLLMINGTLGSSVNITVNGNVQCLATCGTINVGNTFTQSVSSSKNFGTNVATGTNWTFNNLTFDGAGGSPTVTFNGTGTGQTIVSGNLGLTKSAGTSFTVDDATNDRIIAVSNDVSIAATTTLQAPGSASFTVGGSWTNAGTFTHDSGTVVFNAGATGKTINAGSSAFNNVNFNGSGGGWTVQTNPATINGNLLMIAGTLGATANITTNGNVQCSVTCGTINVGNTFTQSVSTNKNFGTNVATGTNWTFNNLTFDASSGSPTITFNSTGTGQTIINGNLALTKSGTALVVDNSTNNRIIDANGDVSIASGTTLQAAGPSTSFTVAGSWTNNGTFTNNSGTVTFDATTGGKTLNGAMTGSSKFYDVTFNGIGGAWSFGTNNAEVANNLMITGGTVTAPSTTLTVTGNYTNNGTFTNNSGTVLFNSTATGKTLNGSMTGANKFSTLSFNGIGGAWSFNANSAEVAADFTISNGTVTAPSTTLTLSSNYTNNGAFTHNSGTVLFNSTATGKTLTGSMTGSNKFYTLTFNGIGGAWSFNANSAEAANNFTITNGTVTAPSTTLTLTGNYSNAGTFTNNSGIVLFNSTATGKTISGTMTGASKFSTLTFNGVGGAWSFGTSSAEVAADLTISNGTVTAPSTTLTITGNYTNNGAFTNNSGNVLFNSTSSGRTIAGGVTGSNKFYDLSFNGIGGAWSFSGANVDVGNNLTITNGILTAPSNTLTITGSYSNAGTFTNNSGTVLFNSTATGKTLAGSMTGANKFHTLTFNGSGGAWSFNANSAEVADDFTISAGTVTAPSTTLTLTRNYSNAGTFTQNSGTVVFNSGSTGRTINSGGSAFNNVNFNGSGGGWTIQTSPATINGNLLVINGTLGSSVNITANGNVECQTTCGTINVGNTFTQSVSSSKTFGTNVAVGTNWTFNNLTFDGSSGSPTISFNGTGTGQTIVNGNLSLTKSGTALVVSDTNNRIIDVNGDVSLASGTTLQAPGGSTSFTVAGSWTNSGTFTHNSGTVTFDSGSSGKTITPGSSSFNNLVFNNAGGTWSPRTNTLTVGGDLTMTTGTLGTAGDTADITVNGDVVGTAGVIDMTPGGRAFTQRVTTSKSFGPTTPGTNWSFVDLTFSNSNASATPVSITTNSGTGTMNVVGIMRVGASGDATGATTTLDAGNRSWTLSGTSGNPFRLLASPVASLSGGTSTFNFTGNNASGNTTVQAAPYYSLVINNGSETFDAGGATSANNNLTVTAGTYLLAGNNLTVGSIGATNSGGISVATGATLSQVTGTTSVRSSSGGSATIGGGGSLTFYNLTFDPTVGSSPTFTLGSAGSQSLTVNNAMTIGNGTNGAIVSAVANDPLLDVNGDFTISANGTFIASNTADFTVAGSWANAGTFTHSTGTLTLDANSAGKTIVTGGTGAGKDFYKVIFNNGSGGWTIQTNNMTAASDLSLTNIGVLTLQSGRTLEVDGIYSICNTCQSNTTWTGSTLYLNSGTNYTVGSKTQNSEVYGTLQIGANTDIRTWNSSAAANSVAANGSLYSQNDANTPGSLNIYGDYHTIGSDYWKYDTDFDGSALVGLAQRQAVVRIETGSGRGVTVDSTKTLTVKGGGTGVNQFSDVDRIGGSGNYQLINNGTANVQESKIANPSFDGGTWAPFNTVVSGQSVTSGALTLDWYIGAHIVDRDTPATNINTSGSDITIAETSGSPAATVYKLASGTWGSGATSQTADSDANGRIVQPNTDNALRIREYEQTSGGTTYYQYNLSVADQPIHASYNYQRDYGKYITSTGNTGSGEDQVIGSSWYRDVIDTENNQGPLNGSVTEGTWYSGMSTSILALWDTADGGIPSGWNCVSCTGGDPFYQRFLRATPTYGGNGGGPESVGHNLSSPNATNGASFGALSGGTNVASSTHTHSWAFGAGDDTTATDIKPPYKNLQVIRGPTSGPTAWPANMITPFRTTTAPTGWTAYTALDGSYPRGENTNTTGGAATHTHNSSPLTSGAASGTAAINCTSGCSTAASSGHTHNLAATALPSANNDPLHVNVRFMKHLDTSPPPIQDMIGLFDHTSFPAGYVLVSDSSPYENNLLRGAASGMETASGSATHNHGGSMVITSGAPVQAATATGAGAGVNAGTSTHTHDVTYTIDSANSMPNYANVVVARYRPNLDPDVATALAQKKTDDTVITSGGWINETSVKFTATVSDPDTIPQQLQLCVEKKDTGTGFASTEDLCGTAVTETGTGSVNVSVTITGLAPDEYHWQARVKDQDDAYSSWVDYGTADINTRDFGIDTTAPTTATIYDNTNLDTQPFSTDTDQNADGSLTTLSATWDAFDSTAAGLNKYEYSVGTTPGGMDIKSWTNNGTTAHVRDSSLSTQTSKTYYFNVRATDNAGNVSSVASSNGQLVTPTMTFDIDVSATDTDTSPPYAIDFGSLTAATIADSPQKIWVDFETNGVAGGKVYLAGLNNGLRSTAAGYTITSSTANLAATDTGFGAQGATASQGSGGPFTISSPYNVSSQNVGVINTTFQSIFSTSNPVLSARGSFLLKVKASDLTPASNDYNDTLVIIAAGTY